MTRATRGPLVARILAYGLVIAERRGMFLESSARKWAAIMGRRSIRQSGVAGQTQEIHACPDIQAGTRIGEKCARCALQHYPFTGAEHRLVLRETGAFSSLEGGLT